MTNSYNLGGPETYHHWPHVINYFLYGHSLYDLVFKDVTWLYSKALVYSEILLTKNVENQGSTVFVHAYDQINF